MDLNVARGEQVQVIGTVADLEHRIAAEIRDLDIESVGSRTTVFRISKSADEHNRRLLRFVVTTYVAGTMPVNDVNRDLR